MVVSKNNDPRHKLQNGDANITMDSAYEQWGNFKKNATKKDLYLEETVDILGTHSENRGLGKFSNHMTYWR